MAGRKEMEVGLGRKHEVKIRRGTLYKLRMAV